MVCWTLGQIRSETCSKLGLPRTQERLWGVYKCEKQRESHGLARGEVVELSSKETGSKKKQRLGEEVGMVQEARKNQ